ncbi:hypothetical protein KPA97_23930, partial [Burkholderia cenocepacia]|nr:hypothetical protein [Burkholderia cenocepacia]
YRARTTRSSNACARPPRHNPPDGTAARVRRRCRPVPRDSTDTDASVLAGRGTRMEGAIMSVTINPANELDHLLETAVQDDKEAGIFRCRRDIFTTPARRCSCRAST